MPSEAASEAGTARASRPCFSVAVTNVRSSACKGRAREAGLDLHEDRDGNERHDENRAGHAEYSSCAANAPPNARVSNTMSSG